MIPIRKTVDEYHLLVNYQQGDGWEHEVTEFSRQAINERRKEYRENQPYPVKTRKVRVPKDPKIYNQEVREANKQRMKNIKRINAQRKRNLRPPLKTDYKESLR
jgi:hypothetical protein